MKACSCALFTLLLLAFSLVLASVAQAEPEGFELTPTEIHHVVKMNSNQPYVAGYDAITPDLATFKPVSAVMIDVNFMSTDPNYFPSGSWLGAGMFVQSQDSYYGFVDYGFYIMLVLEAAGDFFFDVGFYQTRESTAPFQAGTSTLLYAYTWQFSGIDYNATTFTLSASWDKEGLLHYSVVANGFNVTLPPVDVPSFPGCQYMHRQFWSGNMRAGAMPFGHTTYYFQFGVTSPTFIENSHWSVKLSNPRLLKKIENEWRKVELALSTQGDINYIDWDAMWGGAPYKGVSAQYYQHPLENKYEVVFFYNGETLLPGTVLWHSSNQVAAAFEQFFGTEWMLFASVETVVVIGIVSGKIGVKGFKGRRRKRPR